MEQNAEQQTRCGFVALIGAPNAGKSTITNNFVGSKVSIVSPKVLSLIHILPEECLQEQKT